MANLQSLLPTSKPDARWAQVKAVYSATFDQASVPAQTLTASAALDFASTLTLASPADLTITVTGAAVGDAVSLALPAAPTAGFVFTAWVSATNTVTVRGFNVSGGTIDPASATFTVSVVKAAPTIVSTVTCTGVALGDYVVASFGVSAAGLIINAYVSAADTITFAAYNPTVAAVDLASTTVRFVVFDKNIATFVS